MAIRSISLCAGVAGIDLGLRLADPTIRTVCYVEWAKFPAAVIAARIKDGALDEAPVWDDVGTFDGRPWRGKVDLITAGFPCQPVSLAGKRLGMSDERFIWGDIARIIDEVRPGRVLLENVPGIVSADDGRFLDVVLGSLVALGFDCEWDIFSAAETGAPHKRERWFCLGVRSELGHAHDGRQEPADQTCAIGTQRDARSIARGTSSRGHVANAGHGLVPQPGRGPQGRDGAGSAGAVLGDPDLARQQGHGRAIGVQPQVAGDSRPVADVGHAEGGREHEGHGAGTELPGRNARIERGSAGSGVHALADEAMADAPRIREREPDHEADPGADGWQAGRVLGSSRVYPPARNDYAGWAGVPEGAQPAVRRVADGLADGLDASLFAYRNDRLRAVGNGVVPLTVALAWIELNARMEATP